MIKIRYRKIETLEKAITEILIINHHLLNTNKRFKSLELVSKGLAQVIIDTIIKDKGD